MAVVPSSCSVPPQLHLSEHSYQLLRRIGGPVISPVRGVAPPGGGRGCCRPLALPSEEGGLTSPGGPNAGAGPSFSRTSSIYKPYELPQVSLPATAGSETGSHPPQKGLQLALHPPPLRFWVPFGSGQCREWSARHPSCLCSQLDCAFTCQPGLACEIGWIEKTHARVRDRSAAPLLPLSSTHAHTRAQICVCTYRDTDP